jgi:hypothetical protein
MSAINRLFDQNLITEFFSENEAREPLQSCIQHCNLQLKNEQRSWIKIISDNKITIITLAASAVITRIALNSLFSMSVVALPLVIVPILYATYKFSSLQNEAGDRLVKTQKIFCNIFYKYGGERLSSQKYQDVDAFIKEFTNSPRKITSLEAKKHVDKIIIEHDDDKGLGSLAKVIFSQVVKDQRHLDKINDYKSTFHMGFPIILLTAQNIDQFFGSYSFLASKSFLIASVVFTTGIVGGYAAHNYIKHWNDREIGKDTFAAVLPELNDLLGIPQERRAYI